MFFPRQAGKSESHPQPAAIIAGIPYKYVLQIGEYPPPSPDHPA